jgi:hypothetical protein
MIAKRTIDPIMIEPVPAPIDLSSATVELPPDEMPSLAMLIDTEPAIVIEQRARIERLEAEVARLKDPLGEDFQILKNAEKDSGVPRQTLMNWVNAKPVPLVKHEYDEHGTLWICVIDAKRQRFALAPSVGRNGP